MPFVADKIMGILKYILSKGQEADDPEGDEHLKALKTDEVDATKWIKSKIKSIARIQKMFSTLKNESEMLLKIKGMAPDGKIPRGLLLEGRPAIRDALREFQWAKELDKTNERRPIKK